MPDEPTRPAAGSRPEGQPKPDEAGAGQPDADADGKPEAAEPGAEKKSPKGENL
jgi:hypothetical protein